MFAGHLRVRNSLAFFTSLALCIFLQACAGTPGGGNHNPPPAISVAVSPASVSVQAGATQSFSATVSNTADTTVIWQVNGVTGGDAIHGTITTAGKYTAPATPPNPSTVTITAVADADSTKSFNSQVIVTVAPAISVSILPSPATVQTGIGTLLFTATLQNDTQNLGVNWTLTGSGCSGATCGALSNITATTVTYSAPANQPSPNSVTLSAAAKADNTRTAAVSIAISAPVSVGVSPATFSLNVSRTKQFTATVSNDSQNKGVTWSVSGAGCPGVACGTITSTGLYTAPTAVPNPASVTITAASIADPTRTSASTVTIVPAISLSVNPATASVQTQQTQNFTATVSNDLANAGVTWSLSGSGCSGATCGALSNVTTTSVTYAAPSTAPTPATVSLTATSITDNTKASGSTITVTTLSVISVALSPSAASLQANLGTQNFTATVQNDAQNKGASWSLSGAGCSGTTCGSLSNVTISSVTYNAPPNAPSPNTVTLTATSIADATKTAGAAITITPAITVAVSPASATINVNATKNFTATVSNDSQNKGVNWALSGSNCSGVTCGAVSSITTTSVTYTAPPAPPPSNSTVTLTASSIADNSKTGTASILVSSGAINISISPKRAGLSITQTLSLTATTSDPKGVSWSASGSACSGNSCGTFTGSPSLTGIPVTYTAPGTASVYTITATSVTDTTRSVSITIGVTDLAGVTTWHNDLSRDGVNSQEFALNPTTVATATFGKLFSCPVDAQVYAQPLWIPNLTINGAPHNALFVATQHDTLYAFDADASPCTVLWKQSLLPAGETFLSNNDVGSGDIFPDIGIVGTPVIDPSTNTIYVMAKSKNGTGTFFQRLHALSLLDHSERANSPNLIASGGSGSFALIQNQRPGLVLNGNLIYVTWASHGDNGPYHGYVYSFDKTSLAQINTFNDTPTGSLGGIWMAGAAPAVDSGGNLYLITGNGTFDGTSNYGDSFLKLTGALGLVDYFTPSDQLQDQTSDNDFGSGGAAILVDSGPLTHLAIGGGKDTELYVLNRDNMGHLGDLNAVQHISVGGPIFSTSAFWQNSLYIAAAGAALRMYPLNTTTSNLGPVSFSSSSNFAWPGSTPSISSQGLSNGIVWAIQNNISVVVHAYDATNVSHELWNSSQAGSRDQAGNYVKFTVPTIANGKVYVGTASEVDVYGLLP
jgi:hypothetical protein